MPKTHDPASEQELPIHYVWHVVVTSEKRSKFREEFRNLDRFNADLPKGSGFEAVYEVFIGKGSEPDFQIWFRVPSLTAFEAQITQEGIRKFHQEILEYIDPRFPMWNRFLKQIGA